MNKFLQKQKEKVTDFFFEEVEISDDKADTGKDIDKNQKIAFKDDKSKVFNMRRTNNGFVFDVLGEDENVTQGVFLSKDKIYDAENLRIRELLRSEKSKKRSIIEDFVIFPLALILLIYLLNMVIDLILKIRG